MKISLSSTERLSSYHAVNTVLMGYKNHSASAEFENYHSSHSVIRTHKFYTLHLVAHMATTTLHSVTLISSVMKLQLSELWVAFERGYIPSLTEHCFKICTLFCMFSFV